MHEYSANTGHRGRTIGVIGILSASLAPLISMGLEYAKLSPLFTAPSSFAVFALLLLIYDRWLWKKKLFGTIPLSFIRDWNGQFKGAGVSSHKETQFDVEMTIVQTWTRILVKSRFAQSDSHSIMGAVFSKEEPLEGLRYEYFNDDKPMTPTQLRSHNGVCQLRLSADGSTIEGTYWTEKDRRTTGTMSLKRIESADGSSESVSEV